MFTTQNVMAESLEIVREAGLIKKADSRFPFTYHHDFMRGRHGGSRADHATKLRDEYPLDLEYYRQAIRGALLYLAQEDGAAIGSALVNHDRFGKLFYWAMERP